MRDFRKFCRPKFTKIPKLGDIIVKLKCGEIKAMTQDEYIKVQKFFNIYSFVGESSNSSGNIVVVNKETGKKAIFSSNDYDSIKDEFDIVDIVGNKQNPFNNHEYVDLGLPSGTLWATMNVGATSEGELGDYYKFGETTVYDGTDYNTSAYDLAEDLSLENDAANVNWSGDWHIPTRSQWNELISNTTHTYISDYNSSGINVIKFAKTNDSSIFIILPAGGSYTDGEQTNPDTAYYWSNTQYYKSAYYTVFTQNSYFHIDWKTAYGHGFQVRPVCDSINSQKLAQEGDIICHNNVLNQDAIFSFNDWLNVDSNWDLVRLYGITTYEEEDASNGDYVILANGHTLIIKPDDYSKISSNWEQVDTIIRETKLVCKYSVTSTSEPTVLRTNYEQNIFKSMEIDGVMLNDLVTEYTFDTTGVHTVKYELYDETKLGNQAPVFHNSNLVECVIPNSVNTIGTNVFMNCNSITSIDIPNSVISIGNNAFGMCSGLTSVVIPNTVTSIGSNAFSSTNALKVLNYNAKCELSSSFGGNWTNLETVIIGDSTSSISSGVFNGYTGLTSINVNSGNTTYDSRNNCNAIIETSTNTLIQGCKTTIIPDSVTNIGNKAFYDCKSLTSIVIPNNVTSIEDDAFNGCVGLTNVTVNTTTPPTLGSRAFNNTNDCLIYVPSASVETYKAATNWSNYANRIQAIP